MFTDLRDAARSVSKIAMLQRDLYLIEAEMHAITQARRIACGVAGLVFAQIAITLGLLWVGVILYRSGWGAGSIAALSFGVPALIAAGFLIAMQKIKAPYENSRHFPAHRPQQENDDRAGAREGETPLP